MYITSSDIINSKTTFLSFMKKIKIFTKSFEDVINKKFKDEFFDLLEYVTITHSLKDYIEKINQITFNYIQSKQYYINDSFIIFASYDGETTYLVILFKEKIKDYTL